MGQQQPQMFRPPPGSVVLDEAELFDAPSPAQTAPPSADDDVVMARHPHAMVSDALLGGAKGLGSTVTSLGQIMDLVVPGLYMLSDAAAGGGKGSGGRALEAVRGELQPDGTSQDVGFALEQLLEFLAPGAATRGIAGLVPRMAAEGATSAGLTSVQGGSPVAAGVAGTAMPALGKLAGAAGKAAGDKAVPMVRSALKPTVTSLRQAAGSSMTGLDAQANKLAKFILDNNLANAAQAQKLIEASERELQAILLAKNTAVDAPQRAARYLDKLERSAADQALPGRDVATIKAAAAEMLEQSGFGTTVTREVLRNSPSGLVGPSGQVVKVPVRETTRELRTDMMADEALRKARATSRWDTRKQYGEMKGADTEAAKAIERGARDSVKAAIPETKPVLQRQSGAIQAREALDRMGQRAANRDQVSLPGLVGASHSAVLGFAAQWLRNNQMRAGRYARQLEQAIARKDVQTVTDIMGRLGVGELSATTAR
jgi:hypothetical protein